MPGKENNTLNDQSTEDHTSDKAQSVDQNRGEETFEPEVPEGPDEAISGNDYSQESLAPDLDTLLREIEVLKKRADEQKEIALRATAELENVRKRTRRDVENAHKFALEKFVNELLPVIDSLELGITASTRVEDVESLREGMDLTLKKFIDTLEKFGVKVIDPQGERFNPELHEAVSMQEQDGVESGKVIGVMQKGYELNGRLVRPAMVMVAK